MGHTEIEYTSGIIQAHLDLISAYRECELKHKELIQWHRDIAAG